jgi:hypothetical protein
MNEFKVKYPSLYFNWLPNSFLKGLPSVNLVFVENAYFGGCFLDVQNFIDDGEYLGFPFSVQNKPLIVININHDISSSLAHEIRHNYQSYNFGMNHFGTDWQKLIKTNSYKDSIINFFKYNWREMDALKFELKYAPNDITLTWKEWLIKDRENEICR